MNAQQVIEWEQSYVLGVYKRPPIVFERGEGVWLYDTEGNRYLDLVAGIAVNALGYGDPEVPRIMAEQAQKLIHISNLYHTEPHARLAKLLCEHSFADKVFFCNSGAEANEAALKFARKYARTHYGEGKTTIVAFEGAFHGRTFGALAVTPRPHYQDPFRPLMPDVRIAPFNDPEGARAAITEDVCAVIVEPIQGEGGIRPATREFLQALREATTAVGALLIFDEVQCGLGRSGTLWAHEQYGVTPDILTVAKPLAGGLPMGATLVTQKVADVLAPGDHATTFGGGAVVSAVAAYVVSRIADADFLAHVRARGEQLMAGLKALNHPHIVDVRGRGLIVGIEMDQDVRPLVGKAFEHGLMLVNAGERVLRMVPPLIISEEEVDEAVARFAALLNSA